MKHNGREIYNRKVAKRMWDKSVSESFNAIVKERIEKWKLEYKSSERYQTEKRARGVAQNFSINFDSVIYDLKQASKKLANDIVEFIKTELAIEKKAMKVNGFCQPQIEFDKLKEVFDLAIPALKKLKDFSSHDLIRVQNGIAFTDYENLFVSLIELDARFAVFAPANQFERTNNASRIQLLTNQYHKMIESEKIAQEKEIEQDYVERHCDLKSHKQDVREDKINELIDKTNEAQLMGKLNIIKSAENLCFNTYKFIVEELDLKDENDKTLKYKDIKTVLEMCKPAIATLQMSNNKELNEIAGWENCDPHTELFNNLIKCNIRFAFFAPKKSLARLDIDFNKLSDKEKDVMFDLLSKYDLWQDEEFYNKYNPIFTDVVNDRNVKNEI